MNGFVYVMISFAMPELVKVGWTSRHPEERAKELSSGTSSPTPFMVVYFAEFSDASEAEKAAHAALEQKGYRLSSKREFFRCPVYEAVQAVVSIEDNKSKKTNEVVRNVSRATNKNSMANDICEEAMRIINAHDDPTADVRDGVKLLRRAAKLGSGKAGFHMAKLKYKSDDLTIATKLDAVITLLKSSIKDGYRPSVLFLSAVMYNYGYILRASSIYISSVPSIINNGPPHSAEELFDLDFAASELFSHISWYDFEERISPLINDEIMDGGISKKIWSKELRKKYKKLYSDYERTSQRDNKRTIGIAVNKIAEILKKYKA